jgi:hypothetical protein
MEGKKQVETVDSIPFSITFSYVNENSIDHDLQCPVCLKPFEDPKIVPCREEHHYCSKCLETLQMCPICKDPFPEGGARVFSFFSFWFYFFGSHQWNRGISETPREDNGETPLKVESLLLVKVRGM